VQELPARALPELFRDAGATLPENPSTEGARADSERTALWNFTGTCIDCICRVGGHGLPPFSGGELKNLRGDRAAGEREN
jgi:hypothetical protein